MLKTIEASKGLIFGSFLYRTDTHSPDIFAKLWEDSYGPSFALVPQSNPLNDYYVKEMKGPLGRIFFLTTKPYTRDYLLRSKLMALEWENKWAENGRRTINIDTGFLTLENFLLATTKNYSHRVFVGEDIFADLTYYFHQGQLQSFPWTYPDYLDKQKKDFFLWARSFLLTHKDR